VIRLRTNWWLAGLVGALACSSDDRGPGGADVASGGAAPGNSGFLVGDDIMPLNPQSGADITGAQCQGETREAERIGLDMYLMLDISGSMLELLPQRTLATPPSKWDAVRESLQSFVQAPDTAEIGIGLQYFPQIRPDVPFSCTTNAECGVGGPCTNSLCVVNDTAPDPRGGNRPPLTFVRSVDDGPRFCSSDADCPGAGESCRVMEQECVVPPNTVRGAAGGGFYDFFPLCNAPADCAGLLPGTACEPTGICQSLTQACSASLTCDPGNGACGRGPYGCANQTLCEVAPYATPAVAISNSPTRAADIIASLQSQVPNGQTPTGPALSGALEHASTWAEQNPDRQVVTVLATDGFPTECAPQDIQDIASIAQSANSGARPVRTFVIGVFGAADLGADGQARLNTLARAGGTDRAIVINTGGNVAQDFLDALNQIRNTSLSCEFQLQAGAELDFERVNLRVSDALGNTKELFNVGSAAACGSDEQGWYYVMDAAGVPRQINVCPGTCATFTEEGIRADLQIGCATRIR
jgi:hypothetical protein